MVKKLAITIAGAVSLGSFEAGVMYEVIHAIREHNKRASSDDQIVIDVLTGASAGGMTAAVTANKLMFEQAALEGPYENVLYKAWVTDIDISNLLGVYDGDSDTKSVFSSGYIEKLSQLYITSRYGAAPPPAADKHPAAGDKIWLGLAMSNLNGVDYGLTTSTGEFVCTCFQDSLVRLVENTKVVDSLDFWETVRKAAVSCGAFPFAFRPVDVERQPSEYQSPNLESQIKAGQSFCYTDGGTFQNQPLGMTKNLVDMLDPTHRDTADRYYLFVSPHDKKSVAASDLNAGNADFIPFAKHIFSAVYDQSQFQDWITAEDVNKQIALLDARASQLGKLLAGHPQDTALVRAASQVLLSALFPGVNSQSPESNAINDAKGRLKAAYADECATLSEEERDVLIDCVLVLETAAGLGEKDEMKILGIIANESELAGAALSAFSGFFDIRYRRHDYDLGRIKARKFLSANCPLGLFDYEQDRIEIDENLNGLKVDQMDGHVRETVYDGLKDRIMKILAVAGLNWAEREGLFSFVIERRLKKVLGL
ncbi:MAG: patatin-like phospholipase family protein [Syntrophorhabdales bacterium]